MRVLLDENLPADLAAELVGHDARTVGQMGWTGIKNGELLRRMRGEFQGLLTMDRNLQRQQNLSSFPFGVLLVRAPSNRLNHLRPLVPAIIEGLNVLAPGEHRSVGA